MNYHIIFCGFANSLFDTVIKLLVQSANESDYLVKIQSRQVTAPFSTLALEASFIGSARNDSIEIVLDFDHVYAGDSGEKHIHPAKLDLAMDIDSLHYWGMAGALLKVIHDLSPAYVTSYLLDKNMNSELALFKKHSVTSLPLDVQDYLASKIQQ